MKSPFPGMDPYIEACGLFEDFHFDLIGEIKTELARLLPDRYLVKTGERAYVVIAQGEQRKENAFLPDVGVVTTHADVVAAQQARGVMALSELDAESVPMRAFVSAEFRENFIEIHTADPDRTLVTCIEVLSPSNKRQGSTGWDLYLRKRQGLLMGTTNFVEIDLLRGGDRMPMLDPWPNSPYTVLVARKVSAPRCRVWPGYSLKVLPSVPVPLLHPDPDVSLPLQPMIERLYERFRYASQIDYTRPLTPPLSEDESKWLAEQLRQRAAPQ